MFVSLIITPWSCAFLEAWTTPYFHFPSLHQAKCNTWWCYMYESIRVSPPLVNLVSVNCQLLCGRKWFSYLKVWSFLLHLIFSLSLWYWLSDMYFSFSPNVNFRCSLLMRLSFVHSLNWDSCLCDFSSLFSLFLALLSQIYFSVICLKVSQCGWTDVFFFFSLPSQTHASVSYVWKLVELWRI